MVLSIAPPPRNILIYLIHNYSFHIVKWIGPWSPANKDVSCNQPPENVCRLARCCRICRIRRRRGQASDIKYSHNENILFDLIIRYTVRWGLSFKLLYCDKKQTLDVCFIYKRGFTQTTLTPQIFMFN